MLKQDEYDRLMRWAKKMERLRLQHEDIAHAIKTEIRYTVEKHGEMTDEQERQLWKAIEDVLQEE